MPYIKFVDFIQFVEAPSFSKTVHDYLDDEEYLALQLALAQWPAAGDIVPGSGGLRKLRWRGKGKGKRGGLRVIYYWKSSDGRIWLLSIYAKNEVENLPLNVLKMIKKEIE